MKRTVRTRGGRHVSAALGKRHGATARPSSTSSPSKPDTETARLRRLASLVRWVAASAPPGDARERPARAEQAEQDEQAVHRSRATLQCVIDTVDEMVAMVDADGVILAINQAGAVGFGRSPRDLVGRSLLDLFRPEAADDLQRVIRAVMASGERLHMEFGWRDRCRRLSAHPVMDEGGAPAAVSLFCRDITGRARADEEAREHQRQLLRYMRIATIGEMTAALAHELNQPIAAIVTYCNGSLRRLASGRWTVEALTEAVNETHAEATRARDIIRAVARFVRNAPPERTVVEIGALVRSAGDLIRRELQRHGIELLVDVAAPATPVDANVVEVEQVLLNLLRNGMEAVAGNPGASRRIEVRTRTRGDEIELTVRDGGTGFSPEAAERAFDPFFTTKADGMGMGLAICRIIVEQHGGRIWVETGAAGVHLTLPVSGARDAAA